jgi:hypothetical protein
MPHNWDGDSPRLRQNLKRVLEQIAAEARERASWGADSIREWHIAILSGLEVPHDLPSEAVGGFRGEPGLEDIWVQVAGQPGVSPEQVASALTKFDTRLTQALTQLDEQIRPGALPSRDLLLAVVDVCAWAHAERVRIHPFVNGNGRTARILSNAIAMRYGLPPFVQLRPRPGSGYENACSETMRGNWRPTASAFAQMLREVFGNSK